MENSLINSKTNRNTIKILGPATVSEPVPGVADEMLLQEPVGDVTPATLVTIGDETPGDIVTEDETPADISSGKPSFRDNMAAFDEKMFSLGMKRSPTQFDTPADGNCGPKGNRNYKRLCVSVSVQGSDTELNI